MSGIAFKGGLDESKKSGEERERHMKRKIKEKERLKRNSILKETDT